MILLRDISTMFASFFSLVLFLLLFESRYPPKKTITLTLSLMLPLMALNFILLLALGPDVMSTLVLLTCSLPSLIFFWILSKHRDGRFFFTFCLADTIVLEILYATSILDFFLGNTYIFLIASRLILCPLLAVLVYRCIRPSYLELQNTVQTGWYSFAAISLIFYVLLTLSMSQPTMITQRPEYLPAFVLLLLLMPILYYRFFKTLRTQLKINALAEQDNILQLQISNVTARIEELSAADQKFRIERHNFRHKLQTIAGLVEKGQYDELLALVREYDETVRDIHLTRYCEHPVMDAVLATYLQKAENSHVSVTTRMTFPETLPVKEAELATVFANAIENAVNACSLLPEADRWLRIHVLTAPRFMIQISNSFRGTVHFDEQGIPVSQKNGHGFGTRSIVAFCEKNEAFYEFKTTDDHFCLRIVFG